MVFGWFGDQIGSIMDSPARGGPGRPLGCRNSNRVIEGKNGSVVRKHRGHAHISQRFAEPVNAHLLNVLTPYLNYHCPCLFAEEWIDAKGKIKKTLPGSSDQDPV